MKIVLKQISKKTTELFDPFFSNQCTLLNICYKLSTNLRYSTDKRLHTTNFTGNNIEKIIVSLNSNKVQTNDNISMVKICGGTICKPLELIFKPALTSGVFSSEWKKVILFLDTEKATNKTLKATAQFLYSLSAEKFLKESYFMKCLVFFLANNLLAPNQSGFKPSDS